MHKVLSLARSKTGHFALSEKTIAAQVIRPSPLCRSQIEVDPICQWGIHHPPLVRVGVSSAALYLCYRFHPKAESSKTLSEKRENHVLTLLIGSFMISPLVVAETYVRIKFATDQLTALYITGRTNGRIPTVVADPFFEATAIIAAAVEERDVQALALVYAAPLHKGCKLL